MLTSPCPRRQAYESTLQAVLTSSGMGPMTQVTPIRLVPRGTLAVLGLLSWLDVSQNCWGLHRATASLRTKSTQRKAEPRLQVDGKVEMRDPRPSHARASFTPGLSRTWVNKIPFFAHQSKLSFYHLQPGVGKIALKLIGQTAQHGEELSSDQRPGCHGK